MQYAVPNVDYCSLPMDLLGPEVLQSFALSVGRGCRPETKTNMFLSRWRMAVHSTRASWLVNHAAPRLRVAGAWLESPELNATDANIGVGDVDLVVARAGRAV